ncbi:hypothetical protein SAMN02910317_01868 [Ruminococcaceae bacterium FB2012]|nr:hypothetical protein SAMN02910317_01868 [Ruminococcaceae bacterium FB2012]
MDNQSVKRATVTLFAISYYMLYAILLVILEPGIVLKLLLILVFAFIAHGLQLFLTLGSKDKPAPFSLVDIGAFGMLMPAVIYLILGLVNFADLRGTLLLTAFAAFFSLIADSFLEAASGRRRISEHDGDDKNDKDDKGE